MARSDPSSGSVYYFFVDQVGSTRIVTQANGTVCFEQDYFPYGQEINTGTQSCPQSYKFTGYERDWETGLDYAFARYYSARLGRFMSVDPLTGDVGDPQSLNRYAYVQNNPTNFTDPTGMFIAVTPGTPPPPPPPIGPVYTGGGGGSPITDSEDCWGGCKPAWKDQKRPKGRETGDKGFNACMAENANKFSIAGVVGGSVDKLVAAVGGHTDFTNNSVLQFVAGNSITSIGWGSPGDAAQSAGTEAIAAVSSGMGSGLTHGRRTADIIAMNMKGKTGPAVRALKDASPALRSTLGTASKYLGLGMGNYRLAVDALFTAAEIGFCWVKTK